MITSDRALNAEYVPSGILATKRLAEKSGKLRGRKESVFRM